MLEDKRIFNPIEFWPQDRCTKCGWDSIELYDFFGTPMHYHALIRDKKAIDMLDKKAVYKMRCTRCGKVYNIIWQNGTPWPASENFEHDRFVSRFKKLYEG